MRLNPLLWMYVWLFPLVVFAQSNTENQVSIHYQVAFPNAVHHEAEISIVYEGLPDEPLTVTMSASSPGRYAIHHFGKNVYNVKAFDKEGKNLEITRVEPQTWQVVKHDGAAKVQYTLFADRADGTYAEIDDTHAHLNIPATFMWAKGLEDFPISVQFDVPKNSQWKVATQLQESSNPFIFKAPNLAYFMDSPIKLSDFSWREWTVQNPDGKTFDIRLAVTHNNNEKLIDKFEESVRKMVLEQQAIYGELPSYDYDSYTFICDYRMGIHGDGMEHRNSTILTSGDNLTYNMVYLMGTVSHEFFHCWNVERLRPASLEPFDFEGANMCNELWFAEGFTSYYDDLVLCRAGIYSIDEYAEKLSASLNYVLNQPATGLYSAVDMSQRALFVDAASHTDETNFHNCHTSYYPFGSVIGLALDLQLRSTFEDVTLDDYMRSLWQKFGKEEIPFKSQDLEDVLAELTENEIFAKDFFEKYIYGTEINDYKTLLGNVGFLLQKKNPNRPYMNRCKLYFKNGEGYEIVSGTVKGSPLYEAGLDIGDVLTSINGTVLKDERTLPTLLKSSSVNDVLELTYLHHGVARKAKVKLQEDYHLELVPYEAAGLKVTKEMKELRDAWLSSKVKE